jgi:hypothetical protein
MKAISNVFKFIVGVIVLCCSACTGIEMGGKVGVYRVDERQESSRTNVENRVPLKCYFVDCYSHTQSNDLK